MLSKNVVIDAPEQLIFVEDMIIIDNIFWQRASNDKSSDFITVDTNQVKSRDATFSKDNEPNKSPQESCDIFVTCDNGITVIPVSSSAIQDDSNNLKMDAAAAVATSSRKLHDSRERTTVITKSINYDVPTGDAVAIGPSEFNFYLSDVNQAANKEADTTVKITAQKEAKFLPASNKIILEGDCFCTMLRAEPNDIQQKYTLSSPNLTVNLKSGVKDNKSHIEHLTADGGGVKIRNIKTVDGKLLSGVELECSRADYEASPELFTAAGPGMIKLNNSKAAERKEQLGGLSLPRSCYAFLCDFATLKYFAKENRIIADAQPGGVLQVIYIPVIKGEYDRQHEATAAHVEINLVQAADGRTELSSLTALGAVSYKDGDNWFTGSKLLYDRRKDVVKIQGNGSEPCYYNDIIVDEVEINLKTRKVKFRVAGPGTLRVK
jgi:hypothetical protein